MDKHPFQSSAIHAVVADEHDLIRKSVEKVLENIGICNITEAHNGQTLKQLIPNSSFDLYVMDIHFDDANGFDIVEMIRSKEVKSDTPIIIVTGESNKDDFVKVMDLGANEYFLKPIQPDELEKKIIGVLTKYHSPTKTEKILRATESFIEEDRLNDAQSLLNTISKKNSSNPRINHLQAVISLKLGNRDLAIEMLKKNIKLNPEYLKNYKTLSNLYLNDEHTEEAVDALTKELEINPKQILRQIKLANIHLKSGRNDHAIEHFRQALLENNRNAEALYGMGVAYAKSKNIEKSLYYFKRLRRQYPGDSRPLETVVRLCTALGKPQLAEMMLRDEKKTAPSRLDTYNILAKLYFDTGRTELAVETLEDAIKRNPLNLSAYDLLAKFYDSEGDFDGCIDVYNQFLSKVDDPKGHMKKARVYVKKADYSGAISAIHAGLKNHSDNQKLLMLLCVCTLKTNQLGKGYFIQKKLLKFPNKDKQLVAKHKELRKYLKSRSNLKLKKSAS